MEVDSRTYAVRTFVSYYDVMSRDEFSNVLQHRLESAKRELAIKVFDEVFNSNHPVVLDSHLEEWREFDGFHYTLHYRMTAVQSRNVVIPVFTYTTHTGVVEWKCGSCSTINPISATYCGESHKHAVGCGHPRGFVQ